MIGLLLFVALIALLFAAPISLLYLVVKRTFDSCHPYE